MRNFYVFIIILSGIFCVNVSRAQVGSTCANPEVISTLPYTATALNTSSTADNYDSGPCASSSTHMAGNDYVFSYTPSGTQIVSITLSNVSTYLGTGIFVTDACPDAGTVNCTGSATSLSGASALPNLTLDAGTTYYIIVSSQIYFGQGQTTTFDISIQTCAVNPVASFTFVANGLDVVFTNTSTGGESYEWLFGDEMINSWLLADTNANPSHTYTADSTYTVSMVATSACGSTDTVSMQVTVVGTGVETAGNLVKFSCYPNPVSNVLYVTLGNTSRPVILSLYNTLGSEVYREKHENSVIRIPVTNLSGGIYYLKITDEDGAGISRIAIK